MFPSYLSWQGAEIVWTCGSDPAVRVRLYKSWHTRVAGHNRDHARADAGHCPAGERSEAERSQDERSQDSTPKPRVSAPVRPRTATDSAAMEVGGDQATG